MSGSLKVRVNPKAPHQIAVDSQDGSWTSWVAINDGDWRDQDDLAGWHEFTLSIPPIPRQFSSGDVVEVATGDFAGKRAIRLCNVWYADNDTYIGPDKRIETAGYTYVGNLKNLT